MSEPYQVRHMRGGYVAVTYTPQGWRILRGPTPGVDGYVAAKNVVMERLRVYRIRGRNEKGQR